jgi:hypothetical protein
MSDMPMIGEPSGSHRERERESWGMPRYCKVTQRARMRLLLRAYQTPLSWCRVLVGCAGVASLVMASTRGAWAVSALMRRGGGADADMMVEHAVALLARTP